MEVPSQQTQEHGEKSWAQYADCKNMFRFGDLVPSTKTQHPAIVSEARDKKREERQNMTDLPSTDNAPPKECRSFTTLACSEGLGLVSSMEPGPRFGTPSPLHYGSQTPCWVRRKVTIPPPERSLDGLYVENLKNKLLAVIEPNTMNLAANVVLHVTTESGYQWFNKWCPHMNFREVFEAINIQGTESKLASERYNVPQDAIDSSFPKLLKLIDQCAMFLRVLGDSERKTLLEQTRSIFQWIPISLSVKKTRVLEQAKCSLKALNKRYNLKKTQGPNELEILDKAAAEFNVCRKTFETQMLDQLNVLLASTAQSTPRPSMLDSN
ncbi:hypothetical protein ONZ43_g1534 [Nemania bipapillata]|uniref:Uncharacterized protein n=1 Tax=Nemania bipapillata TaxID=110536 RepID=A0ACC2J482_9PEZI|nr:hypothetical protein ONZ43_g1534 [Nemania bipapillata]